MAQQQTNALANIFGTIGLTMLGMGLIGAIWLIARRPAEPNQDLRDAELDEALEETFPASDPISHY